VYILRQNFQLKKVISWRAGYTGFSRKTLSLDVFVQILIIYDHKNVWKSGKNMLGSLYSNVVLEAFLRASFKVGNEEKFFAMHTSLLNLEDGFIPSAMHTNATQKWSSLACLPKWETRLVLHLWTASPCTKEVPPKTFCKISLIYSTSTRDKARIKHKNWRV